MTDSDAAMMICSTSAALEAVLPSVFPGGNKGHQREKSMVLKSRKCVVGKNDKKLLGQLE